MANLTITNIDQLDGARGVETSEQALLKLAGADTIARLTILGRELVKAGTPSAAVGTGDGTITLFSISNGEIPVIGNYKFLLTAALVGKLIDPDGNDIAADIALTDGGDKVVEAGGLTFTVTDGSTAFVAGDYFTLPVAAGTMYYVPYAVAGVAGAQKAVAVSLSEVVAGAGGNFPLGVMLKGRVRESDIIIDGSSAGVGITDTIKDSLRDYGIIVEPATQTAALDNQ